MNEYVKIEQHLAKLKMNSIGKEHARKFAEVVEELMLAGNVSIDDVAAHFGLTSSTLRRHTIGYLGLTPSKYIMYLKIKHSLSLMQNYPRLTIAEVAMRCGFYDKAHFANTFSRYFGTTPHKYVEESMKRH